MVKYVYDQKFQAYTMQSALASAHRIVSVVRTLMKVESILDVGCSRGSWLKVWSESGVKDIAGIDGDYVDQASLLIDSAYYIAHDLACSFRLQRHFDLVQCLEVAEHLPPDRSAGFVADLVAHGPVVLFSAAPPGQGGENHINERSYEYWRNLFAAHDYTLLDCLRPVLMRHVDVAPWYKYNSFIFVRNDRLNTFPAYLRLYAVERGEDVRDISPLLYRGRKALVRLLPSRVQLLLAKAKARAV